MASLAGILLIIAGVILIAGIAGAFAHNDNLNAAMIVTFGITFFSACGIGLNISNTKVEKTKATDYQIICGQEKLIIMDSTVVVGYIPYSDSSDIWKLILKDNR